MTTTETPAPEEVEPHLPRPVVAAVLIAAGVLFVPHGVWAKHLPLYAYVTALVLPAVYAVAGFVRWVRRIT